MTAHRFSANPLPKGTARVIVVRELKVQDTGLDVCRFCSTLLYYTVKRRTYMASASVRLDPETESLLDRLVRSRRTTRSDVLREALRRLAETEDLAAETGGPFATIEDLIGVADDGPEDLAENHKDRFRELLASKARRT